jgi:VWFA-related protein
MLMCLRKLRFRSILAVLSFAGLQGWALAQAQSTPAQDTYQSSTVLRSNTRLVVVDVVAIDSNGKPVPDLKAEDFTVLEDGKVQKISGFTFERGVSTRVASLQLPPNIVSNAPQFRSSSLNVILFDTVNGELREHAYAKDELLKFLNGAELGRPVAIFALETSGLKLLHDFTTDNKLLSAAVARYRPPAQGLTGETAESRASAFATQGDYHTSERGIETTLNQLNALAKVLNGYPGRKNLIWLSESFPLVLFPESVGQLMNGRSLRSADMETGPSTKERLVSSSPYKSYAALVKKVSDVLMAAQVAVYPVDAAAVGKDDHLGSQHTMDNMAESTGGRSFKNSNNLALGLKTSIEDGSTYYTLSYYPDDKKWDGQFRTIHVKSSRPGITLRYRLGYYALDPEKISKEDSDAVAENFSRSLKLDAPAATSVLFQVQVLAPSDKKVVVNFHVDPQTVAFEHKDNGLEYAKLSCTVWAYGKDKDKPTMSSSTVNANLKPAEYQQIMQQHFLPCSQELDLKAGTYTLRMGVLDRTTNKMGTASSQVVVP